jgi:hypothetical protein
MRPSWLVLAVAAVGGFALAPRPAAGGDSPPESPQPASATDDAEVARCRHLLRRTTFGPRPDDLQEVLRIGRAAWVDRQLHPETIPDREAEGRLAPFTTLGHGTGDYWREADALRGEVMGRVPGAGESTGPEEAARRLALANQLREKQRGEVVASVVLRQVYSARQLQEVMLEFWRNHFNVDTNKDDVRYYIADWEREVLRKHVFRTFEEFLLASAKHPAMLFYLDNHVSQAPMARGEKVLRGRERDDRTAGLNENYARELMELHTVGVDNGYEQEDVIQLALVLTGWSIKGQEPGRGGFEYRDAWHARGRKRVMGKTLAEGGVEEGEEAVRYLARHKNTRDFVCTKLVRFLAADEPPQPLVKAATAAWDKTKGDLREVVRAVLLNDAFYDPALVGRKAKTPVEYVASTLRVTGADVKDARALLERLKDMYEGVYECEDPTGYSDRAIDWMDPGVLAVRWQFAHDLLSGRLPGVTVADGALFADARQSPEVWEYALVERLFAGQTPGSLTMAPFRVRVNDARRNERRMKPAERLDAFRTLATLLLGSPEFQRQ